MVKKVNEHYYCLDKETGIFYRVVGLSNEKDLILYPKYIPTLLGERGKGLIHYKGLHFPTGSLKYICSNHQWQSSNVNLRFNEKYNCFLPMGIKNRLVLFSSQERLGARIGNNDLSILKVKKLIDLFISNSKYLSYTDFGIDASMLVNMEKPGSDIDLIVYSDDKAIETQRIFSVLISKKLVKGPGENSDYFIERRKSYSPLMTDEEIVEWEKRKISGIFENTKFSFMPKNPFFIDKSKYIHTNQYCAIRFKIEKYTVVADPGYINLSKSKVEIVWGPSGINIDKLITLLPSRMGVILRKGDTIFAVGKLYKENNNSSFVLSQMPWDEEFVLYDTRFVMKVEKTKLDQLIENLLNVELDKNGYT